MLAAIFPLLYLSRIGLMFYGIEIHIKYSTRTLTKISNFRIPPTPLLHKNTLRASNFAFPQIPAVAGNFENPRRQSESISPKYLRRGSRRHSIVSGNLDRGTQNTAVRVLFARDTVQCLMWEKNLRGETGGQPAEFTFAMREFLSWLYMYRGL